MADNPVDPISLALGGLGQAKDALSRAPGRPWAPAWAPQAPQRVGEPSTTSFTGQKKIMSLSVLEGTVLKVEASPANPDVFIEVSKLPTRQQRRGALGVSFYDLPGVQAVAMAQGYAVEYDPVLQGMIDRWNQWCLELEFAKNFAQFPDFHVDGLDIEFLKFQSRGVVFGCKIKSLMLLDTMGVGKSIETLGILFTHRKAAGGRLETMILAPTSVVGDWQAKFRKFAGIEIAVATGVKAKRIKVYDSKPEFLAMSYDVFMRDMVDISKRFRPRAIALDECQRITNRKSKAAAKLFDFVDAVLPEFRILISGSPISNKPVDLWSLLRLINPELAGAAKAFEGRYMKSKPIWKKNPQTGKPEMMKIEYGTGEKKRTFTPTVLENLNPNKPAEAALLQELRMKIAPWLIRRLKKDVLTDLPEKMYETISITLGKKERDAYEKLQAEFAEAMAGVADELDEDRVTDFLQWFTRAQQICCSLEINGLGEDSAKIDELKEFVKDYSEDQKILIFSRFRGMTDIVNRELKDYNPVYLNGTIPQADRQPLVDKFQDDDSCRLFVATLGSGGVGLTLTAGSIVARLDRWVSPILNEQCVDRCVASGQLVRTPYGLVPIENVDIGDEVLTIDGTWHKVKNTHGRQCRGLITTIRYGYFSEPLRTTNDHRVYISRSGKRSWVEAWDIRPGDYLIMPRPKGSKDVDSLDTDSYTFDTSPEFYNDRFQTWQKKRGGTFPRIIPITDDFLYFCGWYLAEGFSNFGTKSRQGRFISLSLGAHEKPYINKLAKIGHDLFGSKPSIWPERNGAIETRLYSTPLSSMFSKMLGRTCRDKHIPEWIMSLPTKRVKILLDAYFAGDGYARKNQQEWVTASSRLSSQIDLLLARAGKVSSINLRIHPKTQSVHFVGIYSKKPSENKSYVDKNFIYHRVTSTSTGPEKETMVYDLSVEGNHNFVVGKALVHNCHRIGQERQVTVVDFIVEDSVEERILQMLEKKKKVIASLIITDGDEVQAERKIFKRMRKSDLLSLI